MAESFYEKLKRLSAAGGWSEDFARFSPEEVAPWEKYWDESRQRFRSMHAPEGAGDWAYVEKPTESVTDPATGQEYGPLGNRYGVALPRGGGGGGGYMGSGAGGGWGGGTGGWYGGAGTFGGAPGFQFKAPTPEEALADPGYQFALKQGREALENSALARGVGRTSGTLKDLIAYGQDMATQQYGNVYGRQYQLAKDMFAPQYGSWETQYGGNLQKYLQREGNIYGLINQPPPQYPTWG